MEPGQWCRRCGYEGRPRDTVVCRWAQERFGVRVLIAVLHRLDGLRIPGVNEHVGRHTRRGDKYVTVVIDSNGIRTGTGPASAEHGRGPLQAGCNT